MNKKLAIKILEIYKETDPYDFADYTDNKDNLINELSENIANGDVDYIINDLDNCVLECYNVETINKIYDTINSLMSFKNGDKNEK